MRRRKQRRRRRRSFLDHGCVFSGQFLPSFQVALTSVEQRLRLRDQTVQQTVTRYAYSRYEPDLRVRLQVRFCAIHHRNRNSSGLSFSIALLVKLLENHFDLRPQQMSIDAIYPFKLLLPFPLGRPTAWKMHKDRSRSLQWPAEATGALFPAKRTGWFLSDWPASSDWGKTWPNPLPICSALYSSRPTKKIKQLSIPNYNPLV